MGNNKNDESIKQSELYKIAFDNFGYFNKYSVKYRNNLIMLTNPHLFYEEIGQKEKESKNSAHKKELLKERKGSTRRVTSELPKNALKTKIFTREINIINFVLRISSIIDLFKTYIFTFYIL